MIPAQFFDVFGLIGFVILFYVGTKIIKEKKLRSKGYMILIFSIIGIIVDSYNVLVNYILK